MSSENEQLKTLTGFFAICSVVLITTSYAGLYIGINKPMGYSFTITSLLFVVGSFAGMLAFWSVVFTVISFFVWKTNR